MKLSLEMSEWLTRRIAAFTHDEMEPEYLRLHVSRHLALPILIDWTGFWGLRANGEIWLIDTEEGQEPVVEIDERHQRIALFQGARKYPELSTLIPKRTAEAKDCPHCGGTGRINISGIPPDTIIC